MSDTNTRADALELLREHIGTWSEQRLCAATADLVRLADLYRFTKLVTGND
jgi:hypothetical protein